MGFLVAYPENNGGGARLFKVGADDLDNNKPLYSDDESATIALSDDGRVLAVGNHLRGVRLFDVTKDDVAVQIGGDVVGENQGGDLCGISVDLSRDGKRVVIGCYNKALIATLNESSNPDNPTWDIEDEFFLDTFGYVRATISSNGERVAFGGYANAVRVYERTATNPGLPNQITKLQY